MILVFIRLPTVLTAVGHFFLERFERRLEGSQLLRVRNVRLLQLLLDQFLKNTN